jgi:hypothetical protein
VDGKIDVAFEQRVFDFLDEQAFPADFRERRILQAIAGRLDDDDAARRPAGGRDARRNRVRLPREVAAARSSQLRPDESTLRPRRFG